MNHKSWTPHLAGFAAFTYHFFLTTSQVFTFIQSLWSTSSFRLISETLNHIKSRNCARDDWVKPSWWINKNTLIQDYLLFRMRWYWSGGTKHLLIPGFWQETSLVFPRKLWPKHSLCKPQQFFAWREIRLDMISSWRAQIGTKNNSPNLGGTLHSNNRGTSFRTKWLCAQGLPWIQKPRSKSTANCCQDHLAPPTKTPQKVIKRWMVKQLKKHQKHLNFIQFPKFMQTHPI